MKRFVIILATVASLTLAARLRADQQLGVEYKQNNSAYSLWIEAVDISPPARIEVDLDGSPLTIVNGPSSGGVLVAEIAHLPGTDAGLDIEPGTHFISLSLTANSITTTYTDVASFDVLPITGPISDADFAGLTDLYGVVSPVYTFYDLLPAATPTPDTGSTFTLLGLAASALAYRRLPGRRA